MLTLNLLCRIVLLYAVVTIVVYFLSNNSIFVPPKSSYEETANFIKLPVTDQKSIAAVYLQNPQAQYTILYSHGNAEDLGMILPLLQEIFSWGFSVLGYDYQGYGTSEGRASESATYQDINAAYDYLVTKQKVNPSSIIVWGRSVGSGPSVELAANKKVGAVILESPFVSAYRVITHYPIFMFDKYKNLAKIHKIKAPILFVHGTQDSIIPIWHSKKLYDAYRGAKQFYWVEDAGHNDINFIAGDQYKPAILNFVATLPPQQS